jgi:hypothetical protein
MKIIDDIREEIKAAYREPTSKDLTVLAGLFLLIPSLIGAYLLLRRGAGSGYYWIGTGLVLAACRIVDPLFRWMYKVWFCFAVALGYFVSRALLTLIFFLVITPTGLIMRLLGKDPMDRRWRPDAASYWEKREDGQADIDRYERQF